MVGLVVALIIMAGVITLTVRMSISGGQSVQATRLNQALRGSLDLMARDIQRAGYINWVPLWDTNGNGIQDYSTETDDDVNGDGVVDIMDFYDTVVPVINGAGNVQLFSFATPGDATSGAAACTTNCDCVLFSYDIDENGAINTADFELFGYRWNDGAIEMRTGGDPNSCTAGTWQDITDDTITVTALAMDLVLVDDENNGDATVYPLVEGVSQGLDTACTPVAGAVDEDKCLWRRKVAVSITAELTDDAAVAVTLASSVKLKNDYFNTAP